MAFEPLIWYCQPVANGAWTKAIDSGFGSYTPCAIDSLVISISHLVLLGLCSYRIWLIKIDSKANRFRLRSNYYNYMLGLLAGYCTAGPLLRLVMGFSIFNQDGQTGFAPFEIISLIIEAVSWCSMLMMIGLETKTYIRHCRWFVRFGVIYVLVGDAVMLNLILSVSGYYNRSTLYLYISTVCCQVCSLFSRSPLMVIGSITSMLVFICAVYPVIICNGLWTKAGNWQKLCTDLRLCVKQLIVTCQCLEGFADMGLGLKKYDWMTIL